MPTSSILTHHAIPSRPSRDQAGGVVATTAVVNLVMPAGMAPCCPDTRTGEWSCVTGRERGNVRAPVAAEGRIGGTFRPVANC